MRLQIYVDDPWSAWRGSVAQRTRNMATLLLWWLTLGFPLSWTTLQKGGETTWIGVQLEVNQQFVTAAIPLEFVAKLAEEVKSIRLTVARARQHRRVAGNGGWIGGLQIDAGATVGCAGRHHRRGRREEYAAPHGSGSTSASRFGLGAGVLREAAGHDRAAVPRRPAARQTGRRRRRGRRRRHRATAPARAPPAGSWANPAALPLWAADRGRLCGRGELAERFATPCAARASSHQ